MPSKKKNVKVFEEEYKKTLLQWFESDSILSGESDIKDDIKLNLSDHFESDYESSDSSDNN